MAMRVLYALASSCHFPAAIAAPRAAAVLAARHRLILSIHSRRTPRPLSPPYLPKSACPVSVVRSIAYVCISNFLCSKTMHTHLLQHSRTILFSCALLYLSLSLSLTHLSFILSHDATNRKSIVTPSGQATRCAGSQWRTL